MALKTPFGEELMIYRTGMKTRKMCRHFFREIFQINPNKVFLIMELVARGLSVRQIAKRPCTTSHQVRVAMKLYPQIPKSWDTRKGCSSDE